MQPAENPARTPNVRHTDGRAVTRSTAGSPRSQMAWCLMEEVLFPNPMTSDQATRLIDVLDESWSKDDDSEEAIEGLQVLQFCRMYVPRDPRAALFVTASVLDSEYSLEGLNATQRHFVQLWRMHDFNTKSGVLAGLDALRETSQFQNNEHLRTLRRITSSFFDRCRDPEKCRELRARIQIALLELMEGGDIQVLYSRFGDSTVIKNTVTELAAYEMACQAAQNTLRQQALATPSAMGSYGSGRS